MPEHHPNGAAVRDGHRSPALVTGGTALARRLVERAPRLRDVYGQAQADKHHRSVAGIRRPAQQVPAQPGRTPTAVASISHARSSTTTPKHDLKSGLATA